MTSLTKIFFCVGAPKAGTTWLYKALSKHDDCYFRLEKELHYFNTMHSNTWGRRIKKYQEVLRRSNGVARDDIQEWIGLLRERGASLDSYVRFIEAYRGERSIIGDFTPAYSLLPEEVLFKMKNLGDVRILYIMRDPVDRLWSQVRMDARRRVGSGPEYALEVHSELNKVLEFGGGSIDRGNYTAVISKLEKVFDKHQILFMFYEELISAEGLLEVTKFLNISEHSGDLPARVHGGEELPIEDDDRRRIYAALSSQYEFILNRMGRIPPQWEATRNRFQTKSC